MNNGFDIDIEDINGLDLEDIDLSFIEKEKEVEVLKHDESSYNLENKQNKAIERAFNKAVSNTPNSTLTIPQMQAIDLFLKGNKKTEIAKAIGVSNSMISKWFNHDNEFMEVLDKTRKEVAIVNKNHFHSLVPKAINRLDDILRSEETDSKTLMNAIKLVLQGADITHVKEDVKQYNQTQIVIAPQYTMDNQEAKDLGTISNDVIDIVYEESD